MKTILVGLGNPILGDDGTGWKVVEEIQKQIPHILLGRSSPAGMESQPGRGDGDVDIECLSLGGIGLMEHLIGYERAIIIDSFIADEEEIGSILVRNLNDLPNYSAFHITSAHDTSLQNALELGRRMGAQLPNEVIVIGIAIKSTREFGEELSPRVAEAVPMAAQIALSMLEQNVTN